MPVINLNDITEGIISAGNYGSIIGTIDTHHSIKIMDCPKCASNLPLKEIDKNGICTCKFCGKDVYVWD